MQIEVEEKCLFFTRPSIISAHELSAVLNSVLPFIFSLCRTAGNFYAASVVLHMELVFRYFFSFCLAFLVFIYIIIFLKSPIVSILTLCTGAFFFLKLLLYNSSYNFQVIICIYLWLLLVSLNICEQPLLNPVIFFWENGYASHQIFSTSTRYAQTLFYFFMHIISFCFSKFTPRQRFPSILVQVDALCKRQVLFSPETAP